MPNSEVVETCSEIDSVNRWGHDKYNVSVQEYVNFRKNGFLVVKNLLSDADVAELQSHTEDLMLGQLPEQSSVSNVGHDGGSNGTNVQALEAPPPHLNAEERAQYFLRIHMLHRKLALHEKTMLHPRVLDVLEVLQGPDVLALQTMLFIKAPGKPGQGWHQDSYYIPTQPDTLIGAWIALDEVDEENGAMWMALGSQNEPVYPPKADYGFGNVEISDIARVAGISDTDDEKNDLSKIADRYPQVLVCASPGDVVFFGGHVLHRSKRNFSQTRLRRAFVSHYCNARSYTFWQGEADPNNRYGNGGVDPLNGSANALHILARGDTHMPFAQPRFGNECAATLSAESRERIGQARNRQIADMDSGMMGMGPAEVPEHS